MDNEAEIKKIVNRQFSGVTNLTKEAYADSLRMIAQQICQLFDKKESKDERVG